MRILSLCSGYGGLDLAIEEHFGAETVYWSDVDPSACAVMTERFPHAEPLGDLTQFGDTKFDCDVLSAGYPCQPFSFAGPRKGENDERHLWPYIRNTISVSRPRWVVLENVSGHLSLGATQVIADLASLRYDCRWQTIRASRAGAPHQRKRLFILGRNADADTNEQGSPESRSERSGWPTVGRGVDADTDSEGLEGHGGLGGYPGELHPSPDDSEIVQNPDSGRGQGEVESPPSDISTSLTGVFQYGDYSQAVRRWELILGRRAPIPVFEGRLNQLFVEWMLGLPLGYVTGLGLSRTQELKLLGNGVVPHQGLLALNLLGQDPVGL